MAASPHLNISEHLRKAGLWHRVAKGGRLLKIPLQGARGVSNTRTVTGSRWGMEKKASFTAAKKQEEDKLEARWLAAARGQK